MKSTVGKVVLGIALVGSLLLEFPARPAPIHVWDYPAFYALAGILGCLLLSFMAKGVMSPVLDRSEDFYGPEDAEYDWTTESPAAAGPESGGRSSPSAGSGDPGPRPRRGGA